MSLSAMLKGTKSTDKDLQSILKTILPSKSDFYTLSGKSPFSKEYILKVPNLLNYKYDASVSGTAFDYLARMIIARETLFNKENSFLCLNAYKGLRCLEKSFDKKSYDNLKEKYVKYLTDFIAYVYSKDGSIIDIFDKCNKEEFSAFSKFINNSSSTLYKFDIQFETLIEHSCFFAHLEHIFRSGGILPTNMECLTTNVYGYDLITDIKLLCNVFFDTFINSNLVKKNSFVIYNPTFGIGSLLCHGADGDVFIDGNLYDFKTTKTNDYKWQDSAQIIAYYLLNCIAEEGGKIPAPIAKYEIQKVALYKARFGEIEVFDTNKLVLSALENAVTNLQEFFMRNSSPFNV
jgi:hypothetical protein